MNVRDEKGFALIAALWLMVALTGIALQFSLSAREKRLSAANALEEARARAAAEAGIEHAHARLEYRLSWLDNSGADFPAERVFDPWADAGVDFTNRQQVGRSYYSLSVRDAGSMLNLNRASEDELRQLFVALNIDAGRADRVAQAITDWADSDDLDRPRGAEREDYLGSGSPAIPPNAPFEQLNELLDVRGVTRELFNRVSPHLTLLGSGRINVHSASRPVLLTLPGMTEEAVAVLLGQRRAEYRIRNLGELPQELSSHARSALLPEMHRLLQSTTTETRELAIISEGWSMSSPVRVRAEVLLIRSGATSQIMSRRVNQ